MPVSNRALLRGIFLSLSAVAILTAGAVVVGTHTVDSPSVSQAAASSENPKTDQDIESGIANTEFGKSNRGVVVSPTRSPGGSATNSPEPAERIKSSRGGNVTIQVIWQGRVNGSDTLSFAVAMDTHSVDLDVYDLGKLAILRNDKGRQVAPIAWDAPPGGHHRSGKLVFPATVGRISLIDLDTKYVEIVIRDLAGVKEQVLRWNLEAKS